MVIQIQNIGESDFITFTAVNTGLVDFIAPSAGEFVSLYKLLVAGSYYVNSVKTVKQA